MCRNIRALYNFEPPATGDEVTAAALQYVRKVSGSSKPSAANQQAFDRAVREIAAQLVQLYAARQSAPGHAFAPDTPWQRELEDAFPFTETPDQLSAIDEVKADMERPVPMDRVIAWELDVLGSHGMASADYPRMLRLVEAGTLRPQALVERVVGLAEGARLLPSLDTAAPVGVTLIDPRLT